MRPTLVIPLVLLAAGASLAAYSRTAAPASVIFRGSGPAGFKIEGKTSALELSETDKTLTFIVPLKDLTTGIKLRDTHMRDKYLEVAKFPDTRLEVQKAALPAPPAAGAKADLTLKGSLTLHGVTKEVPFKVQVSCDQAGACDAKGQMALNINEFGISIPKYLGVTMKPDITTEIAFQLATR
jgi:polyisoprenoid-binding protein YceI